MTRTVSLAALGVVAAGIALSASQQRAIFTSTATGVRVDVLVTEHGRPVAGLTAGDFIVRDNGVPQSVRAVEVDGPVNTVIALDVSTSLAGGGLTAAISAGDALVGAMRADDKVALTTFNEAAATKLHLTNEFSEVSRAMREIQPRGDSSIIDGMYVALIETLTQPGRSLVVVCTDGGNTGGWLEPSELIAAARRSNAVVYPIVTGGGRATNLLNTIADVTGGRVLEAAKTNDLPSTVTRVLAEFRARYVITYMPQGVDTGGYHAIEVKTTRGGMDVRSRSGYVTGGAN
jgi:VWFA-related protein